MASLLVLGLLPILSGGTLAQSVLPAAQSATAQGTTVKAKKSVFAEPGRLTRPGTLSSTRSSTRPNPETTFTFVSKKTVGVSPGYAVTDDNGTEWSVKQGLEARAEVVMSRVLSAVGYHQPPVYYLSTWSINGGGAAPQQAEARFRPKHTVLKDEGAWSWHENPFIGTQPYNGLRVLMMILNESDLKDSNNTLYGVTMPGDAPDAAHRVGRRPRRLRKALGVELRGIRDRRRREVRRRAFLPSGPVVLPVRVRGVCQAAAPCRRFAVHGSHTKAHTSGPGRSRRVQHPRQCRAEMTVSKKEQFAVARRPRVRRAR
jgi:hypothetical protein